MRRLQALCCTALLVCWLGSSSSTATSAASPAAAAAPQGVDADAVLIIEYADRAVRAAAAEQQTGEGATLVTAGGVGLQGSSSTAAAAAAAAAKAAADRGASRLRRESLASLAAETAAIGPAVAAITSSIVAAAQSAGVQVTGLTNYHTVLRGAAVKTATAREAAVLRRILRNTPSVKRVHTAGTLHLVEPVTRQQSSSGDNNSGSSGGSGGSSVSSVTTAGPGSSRRQEGTTSEQARLGSMQQDPSSPADSSHPLFATTQVNRLWKQRLDGSGVLVCLVDTGISFQQPLFGNCRAVNNPERRCNVVSGYNFVGDEYRGLRQGPAPVAGEQPTDCMGHGTTVASVVGTRNGVAPGVTLGSYRVFGCKGYVGDEILIEAVDRAVRDGCDIINLSLASGSGYAETSIYTEVMKNAKAQGVIMVKAAGNSGSDGPFRADVATAVGAITVASVSVLPVSRRGSGGSATRVAMSEFSSYGPNPSLDLLPHASAPGDEVPVWTMDGEEDTSSGTSFAAPYVSGVLAMWLQHKMAQAAAAGVALDASSVSHEAALKGLVATAKAVPDASANGAFVEPLAWMGAGVIQAEALLNNQLDITPMMLQLPSGVNGSVTANFTVTWTGPAHPQSQVVYSLEHQPAASVALGNGWFGTEESLQRTYIAAELAFSNQSQVVVNTNNTNNTQPVTVQVTFSLPEGLRGQRLLYSGLIRLVPVGAGASVPALSVPYQGYAAPLTSLRLAARPRAAPQPARQRTDSTQTGTRCATRLACPRPSCLRSWTRWRRCLLCAQGAWPLRLRP